MKNKRQAAFTLIEMAIVLAILGFVLAALLLPMQAQREQGLRNQTQTTLENAKVALLGFAQQQGRLPCPATAASNGMAQPLEGTNAATPCNWRVGFLPAATLGIQPTDAQGFALDAWGNRIRYAVTNANTNAFTTSQGISTIGISTLLPSPPSPANTPTLQPDVHVCASFVGITSTACSMAIPETNFLTRDAVAIIYSTGAGGNASGFDETANLNDIDGDGIVDDVVFVSHDPNGPGPAGGEFDHQLVWISPFTLYNAMIQAGQLH